jgi:hypothetical protein
MMHGTKGTSPSKKGKSTLLFVPDNTLCYNYHEYNLYIHFQNAPFFGLWYVTSVRISNTSLFVQHAFFNSIWFILSRRPQIINITSQSQFHMLYRNDNVERMTRESQWSFSKWELLPGCYRLPNYSWLG